MKTLGCISVLYFLLYLAFLGGIIYVAYHFISRYW